MFQLRKCIVKIHLADLDQFIEDPQLILKISGLRLGSCCCIHIQIFIRYNEIYMHNTHKHTFVCVCVCVIFWQCFVHFAQYEQLQPCVQHVFYQYIHMPTCRSIFGCLIMSPSQLIAYIGTYPSHFILNSCDCKVLVKFQTVYILQRGIKDWTNFFW